MDPMLMGIIAAVVVVLLVGFFIMKSRGSKTTATTTTTTPAPQKSSNRPKTLAEQQREMESRPVTPVASEPEINHLDVAQRYYEQKDYPNAINTLKTAIASQPTRADLYLLLLKSYAQQRNYADFNHAYDSLNQLNEPTILAQASKLKQLLDEEQSQAFAPSISPSVTTAIPVMAATVAVPAVASVASTVPDSMDFDDFSFDVEPTTPTPASTSVSSPASPVEDTFSLDDDAFSFDDLETSISDTPATVPASPVAYTTSNQAGSSSQATSDDSFDLSFDDFDIPTTTTNPVSTPAPSSADTTLTFDDFDLDMDIDTPVPAPTNVPTAPKVEPASLVSDEFNFDELALTADEATPAVVSSVVEAVPTVTNTAPVVAKVEAPAEEEFDFDFSSGLDDKAPKSLVETDVLTSVTPVATPALDNVAEIEDFDLSFDNEPSVADVVKNTPITATTPTIADDEFAFDMDNDFTKPSVAEPVAPVVAPAPAIVEENFDFDMDSDFGIEPAVEPVMQTSTQTVTVPSVPVATDEILLDDSFDFDLSSEVAATKTAEFDSSLLAAPAISTAATTAETVVENDTLNQLDALYAQEPTLVPEPVAPSVANVSAPSLDMPVIAEASRPAESSQPAEPTSQIATPTAPTVAETSLVGESALSSAFAVIKDMDTTQLNIDLAEQYIELGEYDSAKRLLNEINNANPTQQSMVTNLLDKIG